MYVYFRDFTCIKYCRNVYMTWDSMFATLGGVFGLCMGGSVISLFEIIYRLILLIFATLRAIICKTPSEQNKPKAIVPWDIKPKSPQFHLSTVIPTKSVWNNNIMY
ncbi:hypothetical protein C0J52_04178 [Blattella germanica]|nr:hypothetical protein C0J52_04178 [Blattella germanica]